MSQDQTAKPHGPEVIMQMLQGAQVTGIVTAGITLDVFSQLAPAALSAENLATRIHCPPRSTRILLDSLAALGLLTKAGALYALAPVASQFLVQGKPTYIGGLTSIFSSTNLWTGYQHFADAVKNDGTILPQHAETPRNPFWEEFAKGSAAMAGPASQVLDGLVSSFIASRPRVRVLDIAAGSGIYGYTLAKHPNVELTSLDWPNVIAETKQWGVRLGVDAARTRYIEGNLFEVDYQGPYDLVLLSHVYHHFDRPTCLALTQKVAKALAPGGRVAVQDMITDDALSNAGAVLFAAVMLVWTRKGETYSEQDYKQWLTDSGLAWGGAHPSAGMPSTWVFADKRA
jgi:2-polyprenyl-3-methyl-5-hydroxy-6-metoxy-1,4-benzoquinol methylase